MLSDCNSCTATTPPAVAPLAQDPEQRLHHVVVHKVAANRRMGTDLDCEGSVDSNDKWGQRQGWMESEGRVEAEVMRIPVLKEYWGIKYWGNVSTGRGKPLKKPKQVATGVRP